MDDTDGILSIFWGILLMIESNLFDFSIDIVFLDGVRVFLIGELSNKLFLRDHLIIIMIKNMTSSIYIKIYLIKKYTASMEIFSTP